MSSAPKLAHDHKYEAHPKLPTHAYCTICGFAVHKNQLFRASPKQIGASLKVQS